METPEKSTVSASAEDIRYMQAALREAEEAAAEGEARLGAVVVSRRLISA